MRIIEERGKTTHLSIFATSSKVTPSLLTGGPPWQIKYLFFPLSSRIAGADPSDFRLEGFDPADMRTANGTGY